MSDMAPDAKLVAAETQAVLKTSNAVDGGQVANRSSGTKKALFYTMLVIFALTYIVPFIIQLVTSFKTNADAYKHPLNVTLARVFFNSMAGYALARLKFRGREALFTAILAVMSVPGIVLMLPKFLALKYFGIYNTVFIIFQRFLTQGANAGADKG